MRHEYNAAFSPLVSNGKVSIYCRCRLNVDAKVLDYVG